MHVTNKEIYRSVCCVKTKENYFGKLDVKIFRKSESLILWKIFSIRINFPYIKGKSNENKQLVETLINFSVMLPKTNYKTDDKTTLTNTEDLTLRAIKITKVI